MASCHQDNQLLLLYGNNGAGKSTILNLVFHLLDPEPYGVHRSAVGPVPFRSIKITLTSGYTVIAEKNEPFDHRSYRLRLLTPDSNTKVDHVWRHERRSRSAGDSAAAYIEYCKTLKQLGLSFHFLSDTRRVEGVSDHPGEDTTFSILRAARRHERFVISADPNHHIDHVEIVVGTAVNQTIESLRRLALTGTSDGYTSVNTIYEELISGIVDPRNDMEKSQIFSLRQLCRILADLREKKHHYAKYGLTPDLHTDQLLDLLNRADRSAVEMLNTVLKPYFDGHNARLAALEPVQKVIDEFVTLLSEFFSHKKVELNVQDGLRILDDKGREIPPESLSSGERQLVVLLCNAISARKAGTILVIDEPEISLNVKWQRRLVSALLTCLEGMDTQIILATHSIEVLSQYRKYVVSLSDLSEVARD